METGFMKENRGLLKYFLLTVITLGIYQYWFIHVTAKEINVVCKEDGKNTFGLIITLLLSIITGGLFFIIWYILLVVRINDYLKENGLEERISVVGFVLWDTIGILIIVGPFISMYKLLHSLNDVSINYNEK